MKRVFGKELAHKPGMAASQGYDYSEAIPKTEADHAIRHRYEKVRKGGSVISRPKKGRSFGKKDVPKAGVLP